MSPRIALYLLHVLLPVAGITSMVVLLQVTWRSALFGPGVIALICGTLVVYTGDRLFERHAELGRMLVRWLIAIGASAALIGAWVLLRHPGTLLPVALPLLSIGIAYPALARIPFAKELAVAVCWALGAAVMPFSDEQPRWDLLAEPATWAVAAIVLSGTLLCDCKDALVDEARGVASSPVVVGELWTRLLAAGAAIDAACMAWWGEAYALLPACFLLVWLATRREWLARPLWGPISVDAVLCLPGPIAWIGISLG